MHICRSRLFDPMSYISCIDIPLLDLCDWHTVIPSIIILMLHVPSLIGFFTLCNKMGSAHINERKSEKLDIFSAQNMLSIELAINDHI